jgi:6-phosphogluconolactonase
MQAAGAGEPRLTLTLAALLDARFLALHIEGQEKRDVFDTALAGTDASAMPVRAVLHQDKTPVHSILGAVTRQHSPHHREF